MILTSLDVDAAQFEAATGWAVKPQGACKGEACVPLPPMPHFDLAATAARLRMPLIHDEPAGVWALGPACLSDRALSSAAAPDLVLPDLEGRPFRLSSLRGQKVALVSWAPY